MTNQSRALTRKVSIGIAVWITTVTAFFVARQTVFGGRTPQAPTCSAPAAPRSNLSAYRPTVEGLAKKELDLRLYRSPRACRPAEQMEDIALKLRVTLEAKPQAVWAREVAFDVVSGPKLTQQQETCIRQKLALPFALGDAATAYLPDIQESPGGAVVKDIDYVFPGKLRCPG
jgi:hypothetical protein